MKNLFEELDIEGLYGLCQDDKARVECLRAQIGLFASTRGFSEALLKFMKLHNVTIGEGLRPSSPIQLEMQTPEEQETVSMAKNEVNYELAGALALLIPKIIEELTENGKISLKFDGETLDVGDKKEKSDKKDKPEKPEKSDKKDKKKLGGLTQKEFEEELADGGKYEDTDELAEFCEENDVTWNKHDKESLNRKRMIKAAYEKMGWELPE